MNSSDPRRLIGLAVLFSISLIAVGGGAILVYWYPPTLWQATGILRMAAYALLTHVVVTSLLLLPWRRHGKQSVQSTRSDVASLVFLLVLTWLLSLAFLAQGRPVALVYVIDRVTLVRANELRLTEFALPGVMSIDDIRWSGPVPLLAARPSTDSERLNSIALAMAGYDLAQRPSRWEGLERQRTQIEGRVHRPVIPPMHDSPSEAHRWLGSLPLDGAFGEWQVFLSETLDEYRLEPSFDR